MGELLTRRCVPCERGMPSLAQLEVERLSADVPGWSLDETGKSLRRTISCEDFPSAIRFVQQVADLAEAEGHHPDITIRYRKVGLTLTTHAIGGLSENDFILAAKISALRPRSPSATDPARKK